MSVPIYLLESENSAIKTCKHPIFFDSEMVRAILNGRKSNTLDPLFWYELVWDSPNATRGYGWDMNPWMRAVEFRRIVR